LQKRVEDLLVGFELLRHRQQVDLIARLLRGSRLLLFVGAAQLVFFGDGSFILSLHRGDDFRRPFLQFRFEALELCVDLFHFGPFRGVNHQQRIAAFF